MAGLIINEIKIEDMIYEVRGKQVMLDSDLAVLYNTDTKRINEAVKRNVIKFPERYCFKLTNEEEINLKSQIATSSLKNNYGGKRKLSTVFTEQGVYMLATILKSDVAARVTIAIMDAFIMMKNYISDNLIEQRFYKEMILTHDRDIKLLKEKFKTNNNHLFYEGQIYDAYSLMIDIFNQSKKSIIIIDNYLNKNLLDILAKTNKRVKVITSRYNNHDYDKYIKEYNNIRLIINNSFHDRFIIIDNELLYHCGASFKDLGNKCFSITKIEDKDILVKLLNKLLKSN